MKVHNWAFHLSSFIIKFDTDGTPKKSNLIRFIWKKLKLSVNAQMEHCGRKLGSWDALVGESNW